MSFFDALLPEQCVDNSNHDCNQLLQSILISLMTSEHEGGGEILNDQSLSTVTLICDIVQ
jgi:hypothetical protein